MGITRKSFYYFISIYLTLIAFDFFKYKSLQLLENLIIPSLYVLVILILEWSKPKNKS